MEMSFLMPREQNESGIAVVLNLLAEWRSDFHFVYLKAVALAHETHELELEPLEFSEQLGLWEISSRHERGSCFHFTDSCLSYRWKRSHHLAEKPSENIASITAILLCRQSARLFDRLLNSRNVRFAREVEMSDTFRRGPSRRITALAPAIVGNEVAQAIESRLGVLQLSKQ